MKHGETVKYYNPKWYPLGPTCTVRGKITIVERVEKEDAVLHLYDNTYQDEMAEKIALMQKKGGEVR